MLRGLCVHRFDMTMSSAERLNRSRCRLGVDSGGPSNHVGRSGLVAGAVRTMVSMTHSVLQMTTAAVTRGSATMSTRHEGSSGSVDIRSVVHRTLRDITRRKCNVVVSGW